MVGTFPKYFGRWGRNEGRVMSGGIPDIARPEGPRKIVVHGTAERHERLKGGG